MPQIMIVLGKIVLPGAATRPGAPGGQPHPSCMVKQGGPKLDLPKQSLSQAVQVLPPQTALIKQAMARARWPCWPAPAAQAAHLSAVLGPLWGCHSRHPWLQEEVGLGVPDVAARCGPYKAGPSPKKGHGKMQTLKTPFCQRCAQPATTAHDTPAIVADCGRKLEEADVTTAPIVKAPLVLGGSASQDCGDS